MRLLQFRDGTFSLVERLGRDIPPYAILSHTWGNDGDEVTFEDLIKGIGKSKPGYRKLAFCAGQAEKDDLPFFWVDTCCIDKSSSAELTEAINSMFKWYRGAAKCYAYLSDVSAAEASRDEQAIGKSRWFARGWTLQEFIAPKEVEFFSMECIKLGDKQSLQKILHEITNIPIDVLRGKALAEVNVDERMSWSLKRQTKREEDAAYSLLGIFDVFMPLIYGEGRDNAFKRLRREIKGASTNDGPSVVPSSSVPFRRDREFVDRAAVLDQLRVKCSEPASRVALVGLGGVGKSQIAIEYSYRVREESPETWIFWVYAGTRARFEEGYRQIAELTSMKGWDDPKSDILRLVRKWLRHELNERWLMIIDNADDEEVFMHHETMPDGTFDATNLEEPLSDFLPQSPNGSVLVTSRNRAVAHRLVGGNSSIIDVHPMDKEQSLDLLHSKLDLNDSEKVDETDAAKLVETLEYMPLAITQAAAFIALRKPRMTVQKYTERLIRSDEERARLLQEDVGDTRRDGRVSNSIMTIWQISFEYIQKHQPSAARLLSLMSLFDRQGIPEWLLLIHYRRTCDIQEDETDEELWKATFEEDIHILSTFSLVHANAAGSEFEMHRLVQLSMKKWLEINHELEFWYATYIYLMNENYPSSEYENWPTCRALFPHAQVLVNDCPEQTEVLLLWMSILYKAIGYAMARGQYTVAQNINERALEVGKTNLGETHRRTLMHVEISANILDNQGKYEEAREIYQRVKTEYEKMYGLGHPITLRIMKDLALLSLDAGKIKDAEFILRAALARSVMAQGLEHHHTSTIMTHLSAVLMRMRRFKESEAINRIAQERSEKALGRDHPETLTINRILALGLFVQGRIADGVSMMRQGLDRAEKSLGFDHPYTLGVVHNLSGLLATLGRYDEALVLYERGCVEYLKVHGRDHPYTQECLKAYSKILATRQGSELDVEFEARHRFRLRRKRSGRRLIKVRSTSEEITERLNTVLRIACYGAVEFGSGSRAQESGQLGVNGNLFYGSG
ncbi:HET-domain-containing protein [Aaosphaeria arxii CBS 175.79]|uniref:HET-domain-containing protein n=1 Tax=Aaosphaeria arxii CBS 175.79 TaxID=1450172 RepID=A0A6A5XB44_9PLEO|nr:HET-domain-containing protein [Aaosphaeria arxii CBS 175.79]KAF2010129.1 HET-domain-containing protein [Aaosphaeria arxii CBS 175.79]